MTDSLLQAYAPLLLWSGLGFFLFLWLPNAVPRFLGRSLYWVGVPLEILALARQTNLSQAVGLSPLVTVATIVGGISLAWLTLQGMKRSGAAQDTASVGSLKSTSDPALPPPVDPPKDPPCLHSTPQNPLTWADRARQGSFILSSVIGNTGFVGLAIAPLFVGDDYLSWIVLYSVTHNIVGTYGIGVVLASYYGRSQGSRRWWTQLRDLLTVPSLWAFAIGISTRSVGLPPVVETGLHESIQVVIPAALVLMGMRISQIQGWKSLKLALVPAVIKVIVLPMLVGAATTIMHLAGDARLALVLMSGMPTAFAGLILAEEYELDRDLIASSIVITAALLLVTIPLWLVLFGNLAAV